LNEDAYEFVVPLLDVVVDVEHFGPLVAFEVETDSMNWQYLGVIFVLFDSVSGFLFGHELVCSFGDPDSFGVFRFFHYGMLLLGHYSAICLKEILHPGDMRMVLFVIFHKVQNLFHLTELNVRLILRQQFHQKTTH
jgi:hypothetical protein